MVWRETISSTATLGFRIEGIKKSDGKSSKDFKTTRTQGQIKEAFKDFADGFPHAVVRIISNFYFYLQMIGSSLLFVHDQKNANVWLIDFAKTLELPKKINIDHASSWVVGNHEDGYLIGINNLINIFSELNAEMQQATVSTTLVVTAPTDIDNESTSIVQNSPQLSDQINNSHEVT
ncbi:hypothetical protein O3M35_000369 [Rhynocoris fuscipes]|uniref:Kinase n=1 Tax=Rhynocoris fuscipes TaxID=488301 RepID=A0AAW1DLF1_9HEMI